MKRQYDPAFIQSLKKVNVRIRKSFKSAIYIFAKDPNSPKLNNHPLRREYAGFRSIDITNNWRALYVERTKGPDKVAYFVALGTHGMLYLNSSKVN